MKSLNHVIVEVDKAYDNKLKLDNGLELTVNTSLENVTYIKREAQVLCAPEFTILKEGDGVILHHNIFRLRNGIKGKLASSNYLIEDNKYFVPLTEIFMYQRDGIWQALDPYCFIKPIKSEDKQHSGFLLSDNMFNDKTYKGNVKLHGTVEYPNKQMLDMGIKKGDIVVFSPHSEYEFNIGGEIYYRMKTTDIKIKL